MRYKKFIINGYRGISDKTIINLSRTSIIPIIGKNESGKTTCLEAINAFDYNNDKRNNGKHLDNIQNLYSTIDTPINVAAEIIIDKEFKVIDFFEKYFIAISNEFKEKYPEEEFDALKMSTTNLDIQNIFLVNAFQLLNHEIQSSKPILIERDLREKKYKIPVLNSVLHPTTQDELGNFIVDNLPFILYFDDFRDRIPEKLLISEDETHTLYSDWITHIDELFKTTRKEYSVYSLPIKQDSTRRSIITEVQKNLNRLLLQEWSNYQFENKEDIKIKIEYVETQDGAFFQFKIIENVFIENELEERYFDISDRSKGFFWYFNFMIKLHFNPSKRDNNDVDTIYLLDEPGSYLHTYALNKLAEQLKRLSLQNKVIYCTHFHNLLNPEFIPINSIRVAEKVNQGKILLRNVDDKELIKTQKNSAYQPILDALEVKPPLLEYDFDNVILIEGIYDYYAFKMFTSNFFSYFPCVSASSMLNQISYMIFLGKTYLALWDNDSAGRAMLEKAIELFGEIEGQKFLQLYPIGDNTNTRLEEYFDQNEVFQFNSKYSKIENLSLYKSILNLFYDSDRIKLIDQYFPVTKSNFNQMETYLKERLIYQSKIKFPELSEKNIDQPKKII